MMSLVVERDRKVPIAGVLLSIVLLVANGSPLLLPGRLEFVVWAWLVLTTPFLLGMLWLNLQGTLRKGPFLVVDEEGLRHEGSALSSFSLGWHEIARISVTTLAGQSTLRIVPRDESVILSNRGRFARLILWIAKMYTPQMAFYLHESMSQQPLDVVVQVIKQYGFTVAEGEGRLPLVSPMPSASDGRAVRALGTCLLCLVLAGLCIAVTFASEFRIITGICAVIVVGEITSALWYWRTFWFYRAGGEPRCLADAAQVVSLDVLRESRNRNRNVYTGYWAICVVSIFFVAFASLKYRLSVDTVRTALLLIVIAGVVIGLWLERKLGILVAKNGTTGALGVLAKSGRSLDMFAETKGIDWTLRFGVLGQLPVVVVLVVAGVLFMKR
jgi:hypothetical protein